MKDIKSRIEKYKSEYDINEIGTPLILIAEILIEINIRLDEIVQKINE